MKNNNLPTDQLKKYGIIDQNNTFSKKLSPEDIQRFYRDIRSLRTMIKEEPLFSSLRTIAGLMSFLERDKNLSELLENSEKELNTLI